MRINQTTLPGCIAIEPEVLTDERGYFFESFNEDQLNLIIGNAVHFVQDNQSYSKFGVLRGLHFQTGAYAQAKLVRVTKGKVLDVAVDLRSASPSYGKHFSAILSEENRKMLFIPRGLAHGFAVLSDDAVFQYKCDNYYNRESEGGLHYADPALSINWEIPAEDLIVSEKDRDLPF